MSYLDLYFAELDVDRRIREAHAEADAHRLARLARGEKRGWLQSRIGHLLIVAGQRLSESGLEDPLALQRQMSSQT